MCVVSRLLPAGTVSCSDVCDVRGVTSAGTVSRSDVRGVTSAGTLSRSDVSDVRGVAAAASAHTVSTSSVSECTCVQCGLVCKSKQALHMHHIRFHMENTSTQCSSTQQQHSISSRDAADVHVHSAVKSPQPKCVE